MSERCAFTSEYIYNDEDYKTIRKAFENRGNDKYLCIAPPAKWNNGINDIEVTIVQGKTGALSATYEICEEIEIVLNGLKTNNPVRFFITEDSDGGLYVLNKDEDGEVTSYYVDKETIKIGKI